MDDDECQNIELREVNTICLYLMDNILFNIMDEYSAPVRGEEIGETLHGKDSHQQVMSKAKNFIG